MQLGRHDGAVVGQTPHLPHPSHDSPRAHVPSDTRNLAFVGRLKANPSQAVASFTTSSPWWPEVGIAEITLMLCSNRWFFQTRIWNPRHPWAPSIPPQKWIPRARSPPLHPQCEHTPVFLLVADGRFCALLALPCRQAVRAKPFDSVSEAGRNPCVRLELRT